jgi:hypothetical protein
MSDDETDVCASPLPELNSSDECAGDNIDGVNDVNKPSDKPESRPVLRDANGKFLPGTARGPGRPHGAKSQFNKQVVDSLQALWTEEGDTLLQTLARDKPEVIMAMVSRMIPQALAAEAITGDTDKANSDQQVTIRVVTDQSHDVLPPREVQGELLPDDTTTH